MMELYRIITFLLITICSLPTTAVKYHRDWRVKLRFITDFAHSQHSLHYFSAHYIPPIPYTTARDWIDNYLTFGTTRGMAHIINYETRGRNRAISGGELIVLIQIIAMHPTYHIFELQDDFLYLTGKFVSISSIKRALKSIGYKRKKITKLSLINEPLMQIFY